MKKTALYNKHIELRAKMVPFAGYEMPVQYSGVNQEHINVRNNVGVFDVSHMGEFIVKGENALKLIQKISSNDASTLFPGRAQYSYLPNSEGGIVDDMLVYMIEENHYMLVVNASNIEKDWNWISIQNTMGAELSNISENLSLIAVQGPKAFELLQNYTDLNLSAIKFYHFQKGTFAGYNDIIISSTGYTGSGGFELYVPNSYAVEIWDLIFSSDSKYNVLPAGLAARDTLRLEMGYCLYGNDINDQTSPISAGLSWVTKFNKEFIGKDIIQNHKLQGTQNKLVAFELLERGIPRKDYEIMNADGKLIGKVTSGTMGPSVRKAIGMGYVNSNFSNFGNSIFINIRNKSIPAKIVKLPFFKIE
jgi:aminomethyltransferase